MRRLATTLVTAGALAALGSLATTAAAVNGVNDCPADVTIGNPGIIGDPGVREIDANADDTLYARFGAASRTLVLIDPNAVER